MIKLAIASFLATLGFAIMFNIRGEKVFYASLCGSVGAIVYHLTLNVWHYNLFLTMLYTSMAMSLYSEIMARKLKAPVTLFLICGLICFVPGGTMYYTMMEILNNNTAGATALFMQVMSSSGALAIGIVVVSTVVKLYYRIKRLGGVKK
ncbi:MAG: threonine/serine exporter family protein [Erysipelotrichales bacterium]|nr:threonine/serine exporter family protein [Erysipelotrichales bacterium]